MENARTILSRTELDNQVFFDRHWTSSRVGSPTIVAIGLIDIQLQPSLHAEIRIVRQLRLHQLAAVIGILQRDLVADLHQNIGDIHTAAVEIDVAVRDQLRAAFRDAAKFSL